MTNHLSRRGFLGCLCCAGAAGVTLPSHPAWAAGPKTTLTPDQALALLKEGNDKFVTDAPYRQVNDRDRRIEIARGQTPFAVLVSCSDSRVPPELLLERGLIGATMRILGGSLFGATPYVSPNSPCRAFQRLGSQGGELKGLGILSRWGTRGVK
jgi:hypothetical protein